MSRLMQGLRNAFAVEPAGPTQPTASQAVVIDRLLREVIRRRMTTPALMVLEMSRPLNFITAQVLHFFQPMVGAVLDSKGYEEFTAFLEHRGSVEHLSRRLEQLEHEQAAPPDAPPPTDPR